MGEVLGIILEIRHINRRIRSHLGAEIFRERPVSGLLVGCTLSVLRKSVDICSGAENLFAHSPTNQIEPTAILPAEFYTTLVADDFAESGLVGLSDCWIL